MSKRRNKDWELSEDEACKIYGGKLTPGSGNTADSKLDILIDNEDSPLFGFRIENKYTDKDSFSINKKTMNKAFHQSALTGSNHFIRVDIHGDKYVWLRENMFLNLINRENE